MKTHSIKLFKPDGRKAEKIYHFRKPQNIEKCIKCSIRVTRAVATTGKCPRAPKPCGLAHCYVLLKKMSLKLKYLLIFMR